MKVKIYFVHKKINKVNNYKMNPLVSKDLHLAVRNVEKSIRIFVFVIEVLYSFIC